MFEKVLPGRVLQKIECNNDKNIITFWFKDGAVYEMYHEED